MFAPNKRILVMEKSHYKMPNTSGDGDVGDADYFLLPFLSSTISAQSISSFDRKNQSFAYSKCVVHILVA